jgi:hypothetical protein
MPESKEGSDKFPWKPASIFLIAVYLVLAILRPGLFPLSLDIYYHLGVMQGFDLAGGIVIWDFWEFAPAGRPHFYPPLLHVLMLGLYKSGLSKPHVAIFFSFIIFPFFVISLWQVIRKIFRPRLAFFVVLVTLSSYNAFLGLSNTLAATLALIILLGLFYAIEKNKNLSVVILTALLFYSHYAISVMGLLGLGIYLFWRKDKFKEKIFLIFLGIVLAGSWLVHVFFNLGYLRQIIYFDRGVEINILLCLFAIPGIYLCFRQDKPCLFFIGLLFVAFLGTLRHPYRFFSTQPAVALIFASALALEKIFIWLDDKRWVRSFILAIAFIFLLDLFSFSLVLEPRTKPRLVRDGLFWNLAVFPHQDPAVHSFRDVSLYQRYQEKEFATLVDILHRYSEKGDIIYSNYAYQAGFFAAFTQRANATMVPYILEAGPGQEKYLKNAKLILWLKNTTGTMDEELRAYIEKMQLEKISETEMFYVYRNPEANLKMKVASPVVSSGIAFFLTIAAMGLVTWDLGFKKGEG